MIADADRLFLFRVGGHRFGVAIRTVARLLVEGELWSVPVAHPLLAGVAFHPAGEFEAAESPVPVFDLRPLVDEGTRAAPRSPGTALALFHTAGGPVAVRLDSFEGTVERWERLARGRELHAALATLPPTLVTTVAAVGRAGDGLFFLFSPDAFLVQLGLSVEVVAAPAPG